MPEEAERALRKAAKRKGLNSVQTRKYVYGGLRKMGWRPKREAKKRGR